LIFAIFVLFAVNISDAMKGNQKQILKILFILSKNHPL